MGLRRFFRNNRDRHQFKSAQTDQVSQIGNSNIRIGRFTYGAEHLSIKQWGEGAALHIGSFCSLASGITILLGGNHQMRWASTYPFHTLYPDVFSKLSGQAESGTRGDVVIGHDVWIGMGATILSGVTIANGAVIGAMSVVTRDVPPFAVVAGNPAKIVSYRFEKEAIDILQEMKWWDLPTDVISQITPDLRSPATVPHLRSILLRLRSG